MIGTVLLLTLAGFVLACVYEPMPVGRPRTWRSSGWVPVAGSVSVLAAVALLAIAEQRS